MEEKIKEWARIVEEQEVKDGFKARGICESVDSEDIDYGTIIGTFSVGGQTVSEMGKVGKIENPRLYYVYIHPNEGMTPHFHVFDKAGMHRNQTNTDGFHTCVEIRTNAYFKHAAYTDDLDKESREALDAFMREIRESPKYRTDIGKTNFVHTINEWDDNNSEEGDPNWVDPDNTEQPNYKTIEDNR